MTHSMTGFATKTISVFNTDGQQAQVVITLKTVNARFFEATCRMPHQLQHLEPEIVKQLKVALCRGHAYMNIHVSNTAIFHGGVQANLSIAKTYIEALKDIQRTHNLSGSISISDLVDIKELFSIQETASAEDARIINPILDTIKGVIAHLVEVRKSEGAALTADLTARIDILHQEIAAIENTHTIIIKEKHAEVTIKLTELEGDPGEASQLKKHQLVSELERMDIHEEIVRFNSHLDQFKTFLVSSHLEKGRRIDFILQELSREINTIGAKSSDATISAHVINCKVELEKVREQIQNIV
jgi:uncharacterized protein (TIGR00255 family)